MPGSISRRSFHSSTRKLHEAAAIAASLTLPQETAKEKLKRKGPSKLELKRLVDFYDTYESSVPEYTSETMLFDEEPGPSINTLHDTGTLTENTRVREKHYTFLPPQTEAEEELLSQLEDLLDDPNSDHSDIYKLYRALPHPRIAHLPHILSSRLIGRLSVIQYKKESHMIRFLSLLDDLKAANVPITVREWSTAIHLAGRCLSRPGSAEVENALYIWREMEREAGVRANYVTFNILFDIATKANKFALSGLVLREMEQRGIPLDRYSRTSTIAYHGARRDADSVRRAYIALVDAGEIVDTAVLNSVITAFLRCHEHAAATDVFARMKALHHAKSGGKLYHPPRTWKQRRELGKLLDRASKKIRKHEESLTAVQALAPLGPDRITFQLLMKHEAVTNGSWQACLQLLAEMEHYDVSRNNAIFMHIFSGFAVHAGHYSEWDEEKLERVWAALGRQIEYDGMVDDMVWEEGCRWEGNLVQCVVDAFVRVCGRARAEKVWEEVKEDWRPSAIEEEEVVERMRRAELRGEVRWNGRR